MEFYVKFAMLSNFGVLKVMDSDGGQVASPGL